MSPKPKPDVILNQYGRDPDSAAERERRFTMWGVERGTAAPDGTMFSGYCPLPFSFFSDLPRLTRGKSQVLLLLYLWSASYRLERSKRPPCRTTERIFWTELAGKIGCSVREAKEDAEDARKRRMLSMENGTGWAEFTLLWQDWETLPDYTPAPPRLLKKPDTTGEIQRLVEKPVAVAPGERSRPVKIPVAVENVLVQNGNGSAFAFDSCIESGRTLVVEIKHPESVTKEKRNENKRGNRKDGSPLPSRSLQVTENVDVASNLLLPEKSVSSNDPVSPCVRLNCEKTAQVEPPSVTPIAPPSPPKCSRPASKPQSYAKSASLNPGEKRVAGALRSFGFVTDYSVKSFIERCREKQPDATEDQIIELVREIGGQAAKSRTVQNAMAVILTQVPHYFPVGPGETKPAVERKPAMTERERRDKEALEFSENLRKLRSS